MPDAYTREYRDPCYACGHTDRVDPVPVVCGGCGAPLEIPPVSAWPREVKRFLLNALLARAFAPYDGDPERGWRALLQTTVERTTVDVPNKGRWIIKGGTPLGNTWPLILKRAGCPPFAAPATPENSVS